MNAEPNAGARLRWVFLAAGGLAIAVQVSLLRDLTVDLAGDETAVGVGLGAWLAGIAVGAWAARRLLREERCGRWAIYGLVLLALVGALGVADGRLLRWLLAPPPGELLDLTRALVLALATMTPAGALVGATFTALAGVAAAAVGPGGGVARLYIWESLGSLLSGLLVSVGLAGVGPLPTILLAGFLALSVLVPAGRSGLLPRRRALVAVPLALALLLLFHGPVDRALERVRFAGVATGVPLRDYRHTPYQELVIAGDDVRHLYSSGQYAASFPDPTQNETLAHTLACFAPRVDRVLALGGLETGALQFLLRQPTSRITLVEPDWRARRFLEAQLPREDREALSDPRVRTITDDPRRFLSRTSEIFDLIVLIEPDPLTLLRARLTTVEFDRLCAARLAPDGVLVESLRTAPNVLTAETAALGGSMFRSLEESFAVVRATPGPDGFLIAGKNLASASLDPDLLAARWRARGVPSAVFSPELLPLLFPPERVQAQEAALAAAARKVAASRDARPVSFLHALARRQMMAGGVTGRALAAIGRAPAWLLALLALAPSLIALARQNFRRGQFPGRAAVQHAVAATGAAGMTWSLLILFAFQTRAGALYGQLGLLTALFMLGLAAGGAATRRAAEGALSDEGGATRRWLMVASGLTLAFGAALPLALPVAGAVAESSQFAAVAAHGVLLFLAGLVTGGMFPVGVGVLLAGGASATEAAGRIETSDHWGAALAALAGAVLFIPVFGIVVSGWLIAAILGLAFAGVVLDQMKQEMGTDAASRR